MTRTIAMPWRLFGFLTQLFVMNFVFLDQNFAFDNLLSCWNCIVRFFFFFGTESTNFGCKFFILIFLELLVSSFFFNFFKFLAGLKTRWVSHVNPFYQGRLVGPICHL